MDTVDIAQARPSSTAWRIPGVGPITCLAFVATIDDPVRFKASKAVVAAMSR